MPAVGHHDLGEGPAAHRIMEAVGPGDGQRGVPESGIRVDLDHILEIFGGIGEGQFRDVAGALRLHIGGGGGIEFGTGAGRVIRTLGLGCGRAEQAARTEDHQAGANEFFYHWLSPFYVFVFLFAGEVGEL